MGKPTCQYTEIFPSISLYSSQDIPPIVSMTIKIQKYCRRISMDSIYLRIVFKSRKIHGNKEQIQTAGFFIVEIIHVKHNGIVKIIKIVILRSLRRRIGLDWCVGLKRFFGRSSLRMTHTRLLPPKEGGQVITFYDSIKHIQRFVLGLN